MVFIRSARDLGFSLEDIEGLLTLWNDKSRQSIDVKRLAQENIADLERRMESIRQMTEKLRVLIRSCAGDERSECPILRTLTNASGKARTVNRGGAVQRRSGDKLSGKM